MDDSFPSLDERLQFFYEQTCYRVYEPRFDIYIGKKHDKLDQWLSELGKDRWGFITAVNPRSQPQPVEKNREAHRRLGQLLDSIGFEWYRGFGIARVGNWPAEPSYFVPGISESAIRDLGRKFGQNAVVFGKVGEEASPFMDEGR